MLATMLPAQGLGRRGHPKLLGRRGYKTSPGNLRSRAQQVGGTFSNPLNFAVDGFPCANSAAVISISFKERILRGKEFDQLPRNH